MNKITLSHLYLLRIQTTLCKKLALNSPDSTKFPCTRSFIHVCLRYERFSHYVPPSKIKFKIFLKFLSVSACINRWGVYQLVFGKNVFSLFSTFLDQIQENFFSSKFLSISACINRWGVYQLVFWKNVFSLFLSFLRINYNCCSPYFVLNR